MEKRTIEEIVERMCNDIREECVKCGMEPETIDSTSDNHDVVATLFIAWHTPKPSFRLFDMVAELANKRFGYEWHRELRSPLDFYSMKEYYQYIVKNVSAIFETQI